MRISSIVERQSGNVAMMTALALVPLIATAGLAIDYQAAVNAKSKVQAIADMALISGINAIRDGGNEGTVRTNVQATIKAQVEQYSSDVSCDPASFSATGDEDTPLGVSVSCEVSARFLPVLVGDQVRFKVASSPKWNDPSLEVSFVFDVSGSMASSKFDLADAATVALDILLPESGAAPIEDTRIAMVNYNTTVNAGDLFETATGLNRVRTYWFKDDFIEPNTGKAKTVIRTTKVKNTCVYDRVGDHAYTDVLPNPQPPGAPPLMVPVGSKETDVGHKGNWYDDPYNHMVSPAEDNLYGFVSTPFNYVYDHPKATNTRWQVSEGLASCHDTPVLPLTDSREGLEAYLTDLRTKPVKDGTSAHTGLAWGWYLLSENWRDAVPSESRPALYSDDNTHKALIFMTDGVLTGAVGVGFDGAEYNPTQIETYARRYCDAIKTDAGIELYTVGFGRASKKQKAKKFVTECASSADHAFFAADAAQLSEVYSKISESVISLHFGS